MATSSFKATERKSDRLEAFVDAVLAIAITLPVTELHAPEPTDGDLAAAYLVRRQNIRHNSRRRLAECGPRQGVDVRRRTCGAASADVRWSVA